MFVEPLPSLYQTWADKTAKNKIKNHSSFVSAGSFQSSIFFLLSPIESCIADISSSYKNKMIMSININGYETDHLKQPSFYYIESADLLSL